MSENGDTTAAGEGLSDEEMVEQVQEQTPAEERYKDVFEREKDGTTTDTEAAKATGDELAGE
ncbi:hypothetical protein [Jatrophihabitans endophyticus]|uniref:hypothetical protein n=1 Tax=Jatrophihabitans endophyticus TaxID=1206085 RepID=UPI0019F91A47|nr:hypothetical protein [Jatrophihabitans endophyticus]MBE7188616.1 hypothetical protein [Jatrophihabitans endophyticus]